MIKQLVRTLFLLGAVFVVPLLPKSELIGTWPVLTSVLAAAMLDSTSPKYNVGDVQKKTKHGQWDMLFLFITGVLSYLVPVLDYAYGREARPPIQSVWSILGLISIFGGLGFRYWSIRTLGKFFTADVQVQADQTIITKGPYRFIRHPSYLGSFVMAIGISIIFRSYVGLAFCFLGFFLAYMYRITMEEKALVSELGAPYEEYKRKTWRLLPLVY